MINNQIVSKWNADVLPKLAGMTPNEIQTEFTLTLFSLVENSESKYQAWRDTLIACLPENVKNIGAEQIGSCSDGLPEEQLAAFSQIVFESLQTQEA